MEGSVRAWIDFELMGETVRRGRRVVATTMVKVSNVTEARQFG